MLRLPEKNYLNFLIIKKDTPYYGIDRMRMLDRLIKQNVAADMPVYRPEERKREIKDGGSFFAEDYEGRKSALWRTGKIIEEWLLKADEDFEFASSVSDLLDYHAKVCFYYHQAVKKYLIIILS